MTQLIFAALMGAMLLISACETVEPEPVEVGMLESEFAPTLASAKSTRPATSAERRLTELLDNNTLTTDMQARALFARGSLRRLNGLNRRDAVKDFDKMLQIAPNHHLANNARIERGYLQNDIRLAAANRNSGRLLSIGQWFDDEWRQGDRAAAAKRYQTSGLSPTQAQTKLMMDAGYICRNGGSGGPVYKFGDRRSDLTGLNWCQTN